MLATESNASHPLPPSALTAVLLHSLQQITSTVSPNKSIAMAAQMYAVNESEWELHKPMIIDLYQGNRLKDVAAILRHRKGFRATSVSALPGNHSSR